MASTTFEQVARAAEKLTPEEQAALIRRLQINALTHPSGSLTRAQVLEEFERRKSAGAFEHVESLRGKFAHPDLSLTFEEIQAITHEAATEWEKEWDEFIGDD